MSAKGKPRDYRSGRFARWFRRKRGQQKSFERLFADIDHERTKFAKTLALTGGFGEDGG
jgi:hypothetical protein